MFKDLDYKKIYIETYGMTRSQIAKLIYEKQKRIMELEEINEEHRKLNGKLLDINKKFEDWIDSLEETDMQDEFVVVRLSDIKNKLKELETKMSSDFTSAKEMFKELGYEYQEGFFEEELADIRYIQPRKFASCIVFNLKTRSFNLFRFDNEYKNVWCYSDMFKAIIQQAKELGWLDDRK